MTKSRLKLGLFITILVLFLSLQSEGKKAKTKGCIGPKGKVYKKKQILNVDECYFKKCNKKRKINVFQWSKLKLKKKQCCKYNETVLSNGMEKEVDGVMVICDNGKIEITLSEKTYNWHDFKRNLDENCHESHSVARNGFPLLAQMKELQDYAEDIESEKMRILRENTTWVCGRDELRTLIQNERLAKTFSSLRWEQWFEEIFIGQTRSAGLPWKSILNRYEDKFQEVNVTTVGDTRIVGGKIVSPHYKYKFQALIGSYCGGSIITSFHILTAEHCVSPNQDPDDIVVGVGLHYTWNTGHAQISKVHSYIRGSGDILILRLKNPVQINSRVAKIDYHQHSSATYDNKIATVTGWGDILHNGPASQELREVDLKVLSTCIRTAWKIKNGADCWSRCGNKGGYCQQYCGYGGYCCRNGWGGCPAGAADVAPHYHTCVEQTEWRKKSDEDCWSRCGNRGGSCSQFCGYDSYCCRNGYGGCPAGAAEVSPHYHTCVEKTDRSDYLCAWSSGKDSCQGDSGGPLFLPINNIYKQIGIVSKGPICGTGAGIYVAVAKYQNWINNNVRTGNCIGSDWDWSCCSSGRQCDVGEGDCDSDADCKGDLECGDNNCKKWNKNAHSNADCCEEDDCFAPGSIITMEDGSFKKIEDLRIGDSVLTANANFKPEFSKFLGWLHKDETKPTVYLELHTKNASIKISPKHLILKKGLHGEEIFAMAKHISLGDNILIKFPREDSFRWDPVQKILTQNKIGVYAPLTESGTLVVDNNVASCYAEISDHNLAHSVMAPVRLIPSILEDEGSQWKSGIRTYPMNLFRMAKVVGLIHHGDTITDASIEKKSWMNLNIMNILNIELLVLLKYYVLKK